MKLSTIGNKNTSNRMDKISSVAILDAGAQYGKVSFDFCSEIFSFVIVVVVFLSKSHFQFS